MSARRINLLPAEFADRRRARQRLRAIVAAAMAVVILLGAAYVFESQRVNDKKQQLATEQVTISGLQSQVQDLTDFQALQGELRKKTALLADLTNSEVRWSVILADISLVIPQDAWLTNFTASVAAQSSNQSSASSQPAILGQIEMDGTTFSHLEVASWLIRLAQVDAFAFPYLTLSTKAVIGATGVVNFNSTAQLSPLAFRRNQSGAQRRL